MEDLYPPSQGRMLDAAGLSFLSLLSLSISLTCSANALRAWSCHISSSTQAISHWSTNNLICLNLEGSCKTPKPYIITHSSSGFSTCTFLSRHNGLSLLILSLRPDRLSIPLSARRLSIGPAKVRSAYRRPWRVFSLDMTKKSWHNQVLTHFYHGSVRALNLFINQPIN